MIGIVVYTGHNTKIMKNTTASSTNISNIESKLNILILFILLLECLCCGVSSLLSYVSCKNNREYIHYLGQHYSCTAKAWIAFGSYFILYNTFIPISLIVSLEFVKLFQGYLMEEDPEMYSLETNRSLKANAVSLNEELGQVEFVMSDKTGTLTCNLMVFKELVIGNQLYAGMAQESEMPKASSVQALRNHKSKSMLSCCEEFDFQGLRKTLSIPVHELQPRTLEEIILNERLVVEELMNIIVTCHECLREPKTKKYQGPSPDEVSLVEAAAKSGYEYISTENKVITVNKLGREDKFELLQVFEFDSDRKRMSVIVRHNGLLKLYVKGADTTILPRLSKSKQPFLEYINKSATEMSVKGLRSLYYAVRILPTELRHKIPLTSEIECDLTLLGLTGIEDKLQDFVP